MRTERSLKAALLCSAAIVAQAVGGEVDSRRVAEALVGPAGETFPNPQSLLDLPPGSAPRRWWFLHPGIRSAQAAGGRKVFFKADFGADAWFERTPERRPLWEQAYWAREFAVVPDCNIHLSRSGALFLSTRRKEGGKEVYCIDRFDGVAWSRADIPDYGQIVKEEWGPWDMGVINWLEDARGAVWAGHCRGVHWHDGKAWHYREVPGYQLDESSGKAAMALDSEGRVVVYRRNTTMQDFCKDVDPGSAYRYDGRGWEDGVIAPLPPRAEISRLCPLLGGRFLVFLESDPHSSEFLTGARWTERGGETAAAQSWLRDKLDDLTRGTKEAREDARLELRMMLGVARQRLVAVLADRNAKLTPEARSTLEELVRTGRETEKGEFKDEPPRPGDLEEGGPARTLAGLSLQGLRYVFSDAKGRIYLSGTLRGTAKRKDEGRAVVGIVGDKVLNLEPSVGYCFVVRWDPSGNGGRGAWAVVGGPEEPAMYAHALESPDGSLYFGFRDPEGEHVAICRLRDDRLERLNRPEERKYTDLAAVMPDGRLVLKDENPLFGDELAVFDPSVDKAAIPYVHQTYREVKEIRLVGSDGQVWSCKDGLWYFDGKGWQREPLDLDTKERYLKLEALRDGAVLAMRYPKGGGERMAPVPREEPDALVLIHGAWVAEGRNTRELVQNHLERIRKVAQPLHETKFLGADAAGNVWVEQRLVYDGKRWHDLYEQIRKERPHYERHWSRDMFVQGFRAQAYGLPGAWPLLLEGRRWSFYSGDVIEGEANVPPLLVRFEAGAFAFKTPLPHDWSPSGRCVADAAGRCYCPVTRRLPEDQAEKLSSEERHGVFLFQDGSAKRVRAPGEDPFQLAAGRVAFVARAPDGCVLIETRGDAATPFHEGERVGELRLPGISLSEVASAQSDRPGSWWLFGKTTLFHIVAAAGAGARVKAYPAVDFIRPLARGLGVSSGFHVTTDALWLDGESGVVRLPLGKDGELQTK